MSLDFKVRDIMHNVIVKFVGAFLPEAKKPYNAKAVHQPELDVHGIASKGSVYNITTSSKVIEEGLNAAMELITYLVADGFRIRTPLFSIKLKVPGEYDGSETFLPNGYYPQIRLQATGTFRNYIRDNVKFNFDGIDERDGLIAEATDEATGLVDETATIGNLLTIHGYGLKLDTYPGHHTKAAVFFKPPTGVPIEAKIIAVNEPRTLKILVPQELQEGTKYQIVVNTMSPVKGHAGPLKKMRDMRSEFTVTASKM